VPITVAEARETGALGAAIGAGVGTGIFADYEAGIKAMTRPGAAFDPNPAMKTHYDQRYKIYRELAETLESFWAGLSSGNGTAPAKGE
jgi:L-xylulokinase